MLRALTANLVAHERIETTDAKAKELRRVAERLITRAIRLGPVAYTPQKDLGVADQAKRHAAQLRMGQFLRRFGTVNSDGEERRIDLIEKVFLDLARRFKARPGGYTRIVKLGRRRGDNAPMSLVEFVELGASAPGTAVAEDGDKKAKKPKAEAGSKAEKSGKASKDEKSDDDKPAAKKPKKAAKAEKAEG